MKQWIAALLAFVMIASLVGCQTEAPAQEGTAFYYCTAELNFSMDSKAIMSEQRTDAKTGTLAEIFTLYLAGPKSETLRSPFPGDLKVVEVYQGEGALYIKLSDPLANLTGLELTMACCCLYLTGAELTGAGLVVISADGALLNGQKSITMNKESLLLLDTVLEGD